MNQSSLISRSRIVLSMIALSLTVAACGDGPSTTVGSETGAATGDSNMPTVTVGLVPALVSAPVYLGVSKGFFADEGIDVKMEQGSGGAAILTSVVQGSYDIGITGSTPAMVAASAGLPISIIAGNTATLKSQEGANAVVVSKDSPINSYADLRGKTVAVNALGSLFDVCLRSSLIKNNVDPKDVKIVELPFDQIAPTVAKGQAQAGTVTFPFLANALASGLRSIGNPCTDGLPDESPEAFFVASSKPAKDKASQIQAFVAGLKTSQKYLVDHPSEQADIVSTFTPITAEVAADMTPYQFSTDINRAAYDDLVTLLVDLKSIPSAESIKGLLP